MLPLKTPKNSPSFRDDESRFTPTGSVWREKTKQRSEIVRAVCSALHQQYGAPRHGNPQNATDDLVFIILSNKTPPTAASAAYAALLARFGNWDNVAASRASRIRDVIKAAGLSRVKSGQIREALRRIRRDYDGDLSVLSRRPEAEAEAYLTSLPGVSKKVAKCVMMYTLGFDVLPVDVHVHRIATRLGWTARKSPRQSHEELEALVPASMRYVFHVACVAHGRSVCRPRPHCEACPLVQWCDYQKKTSQRS